MNILKSWYQRVIRVDSVYKINISNSLQLPKISHATLNICSKSIVEDPKSILYFMIALKLITCQVPIVCKAKKSIATFKIRKGILLGSKVTLRNNSLSNFLNLFIFLVLPNVKELKSYKLTKGCLSIGISDLLIFPQLAKYYDKFPKNITCIVNLNINTRDESFSRYLFTSLQLPVKKSI
jgi:large subunit ribosomal protein L5|uniref:ribosomal protein L5 n=1 Tax=Cryptomonas pyrenoidifera TaxID=233184 RepID=UPI00226D01C8|nr:ribosomal protein L5 [Cryptomonas pyrenoidifera]UZP15126.1 ribosomal protein L5 [Cryptomonas pyrenoidifera]